MIVRLLYISPTNQFTEQFFQVDKLIFLLTIPNNAATKSLQSRLTLRDPIDGSLPGSPIPGIL